MAGTIDLDTWACPLPLRDYPRIVLGHGGGGALTQDLVEHLFLPAFSNPSLDALADASVLDLPAGRVAMTTDAFVVRPLFFPGGCIGDLAVNGTVNDLAMAGAQPLHLTAGFILEEGLSMSLLGTVVARMAEAARRAGVEIVAGDTKVVERGRGDGLYVTTAGVGLVGQRVRLGPHLAEPGDRVVVSGSIGDHGIAVMSQREGLEFDTVVESDCAPLHDLVRVMLEVPEAVHALRDPTRGGLAATLNEIARQSRVGMLLDERQVVVDPQVRSACELLGLDPYHVANEGKLVAIVAREHAETILARMHAHPLGRRATIAGEVTAERPGMVAVRTTLGTTRVVPLPLGELLPRIC